MTEPAASDMKTSAFTHPAQAKLMTVATFPKHYFLENLSARRDGSFLVTASTQKELWYIPRIEGAPVKPILIYTFDHIAMGIAEAEPDTFLISVSDDTTHNAYLMRLDLTGWVPGASVTPEIVLTLNGRARLLNGSCFVAPSVLLLADSFAGVIWRIDLPGNGRAAHAEVWAEHASMAPDCHRRVSPAQPGVNGLRFAPRSNTIYYTSTAQQLFMRVPVDATTSNPAGEPELVASGMMGDDFCIDEDTGVAYVATHRQNTIDRVPLAPRQRPAARHIVAGDPFDEQLVGPSSGVWGRQPGDYGARAYFTTDGGAVAAPQDGIVRNAKVLRVELVSTPTQSIL
jgi:hypothetical protein